MRSRLLLQLLVLQNSCGVRRFRYLRWRYRSHRALRPDGCRLRLVHRCRWSSFGCLLYDIVHKNARWFDVYSLWWFYDCFGVVLLLRRSVLVQVVAIVDYELAQHQPKRSGDLSLYYVRRGIRRPRLLLQHKKENKRYERR